MSYDTLPEWGDIAEVAGRLQLAAGPAELHGALCGWLAGGGADSPAWPAQVLADPALPAPTGGDALDRLREVSKAQYDDDAFGFDLLLPHESSPLAERAEALFDWCRGFLGGFGLAHGDKPLSDEAGEALADLGRLATASVDADESDEESLVEIEEYVRVAALLLHGDCVLGPIRRRRLN